MSYNTCESGVPLTDISDNLWDTNIVSWRDITCKNETTVANCLTTKIILGIIMFLLIVLFIYAIMWEIGDHEKLCSRPHISGLNKRKRERELRFYGCYNYENAVDWRLIYIGSFLATVIICTILEMGGNGWLSKGNYWVPFLTLVTIFIIFYIILSFRRFHVHRVMCSKIDDRLQTI